MLEFLLTLLFEVGFEIVIEGIFEMIGYAVEGFGFKGKGRSRVLAYLVLAAIGALFGFLSTLVFPNRILDQNAFRGISVVLSPMITGFLMHLYGTWSAENGRRRTYLATFWGGALFAFGLAAVRFYFVGSR